jgi:NADPH-dependent 2,4-dienoyl-CoA reductase/sulfur reductase-like enzyme/rhodanese-related sulfurtransferase
MESPRNIVVIGGMACGPKAAARARRLDAGARITIVERGDTVSEGSCGLPYYVSGVIPHSHALSLRTPRHFKDQLDIDVMLRTEVLSIDRGNRRVTAINRDTGQNLQIEYDELVLATGGTPRALDIRGVDLKGVFTLSRLSDALAVREYVSSRSTHKAVVVGAGLIGLETVEAFSSMGLEVSLIEAFDRVLPAMLDGEISAHVEEYLRRKGVDLRLGQPVTALHGDRAGKVSRVATESSALEADIVLMALGVRPNTRLASESGLAIGTTGGIAVDERLRTSDARIYAGGDCVQTLNRITQQPTLAPMGSTANKHGRVIGTNLAGGFETFPGVVGTAMLKLFDYNIGRTGLSESQARQAGYDVVTCLVSGTDRAGYYPEGSELLIKLIVDSSSDRLLGGQLIGPGEVAKRVDVLATVLSFNGTASDLANLDLGYAPPYNSAMDPLHHAANVVRNKRAGYARSLTPAEVKGRIESGDHFILLDVRSPEEWEESRIDGADAVLIPIDELRSRLNELPRDAEVVTYCQRSVRAYQAEKILEGAGFKDVKFLDGSIVGWPYSLSGKRPGWLH